MKARDSFRLIREALDSIENEPGTAQRDVCILRNSLLRLTRTVEAIVGIQATAGIVCPHCGGSMVGDGFTRIRSCERVDILSSDARFMAPDEGPIFCGEEMGWRMATPYQQQVDVFKEALESLPGHIHGSQWAFALNTAVRQLVQEKIKTAKCWRCRRVGTIVDHGFRYLCSCCGEPW